jgi:hypothetical protein
LFFLALQRVTLLRDAPLSASLAHLVDNVRRGRVSLHRSAAVYVQQSRSPNVCPFALQGADGVLGWHRVAAQGVLHGRLLTAEVDVSPSAVAQRLLRHPDLAHCSHALLLGNSVAFLRPLTLETLPAPGTVSAVPLLDVQPERVPEVSGQFTPENLSDVPRAGWSGALLHVDALRRVASVWVAISRRARLDAEVVRTWGESLVEDYAFCFALRHAGERVEPSLAATRVPAEGERVDASLLVYEAGLALSRVDTPTWRLAGATEPPPTWVEGLQDERGRVVTPSDAAAVEFIYSLKQHVRSI